MLIHSKRHRRCHGEDRRFCPGDRKQDPGSSCHWRLAHWTTQAVHLSSSQGEGSRGIAEESLGFKKSQTFNFEIRGIDIGDVDGDKKNEVVVMDTHNLYVFKYDGEKLNLFQKIEAGDHNSFLTLDVADVNRNGHAEIIVTSVFGSRVDRLPQLQSFIFEYEEGRFRKITEKAGWYFRVLHDPKGGPILMGQQMGTEGVFDGPIYKMVWSKKSYEKGPKMAFPKGMRVFGLTTANLRDEGKPELLTIDSMDYLNILSEKGKTLWRSRDRFGGTNIFYDTYAKTTEGQNPLMLQEDGALQGICSLKDSYQGPGWGRSPRGDHQ